MGPTALKAAGAAGSMAMCGVAVLAVAADQHPAAAPLRPPVAAAASVPAAAGTTGLVIPTTATCAGGRATTTTAPPPTAIAPLVAQLSAAKTAADRQTVLAGLTADQRMQVTAYLQTAAAARRGQGSSLNLGCRGATAAGGQPAAGGSVIGASVVAGDSAPVIVSAVS